MGLSSRPQLPEPRLPLARYRLTFEALGEVHLPRCQGSLWRGALGSELLEPSNAPAGAERGPAEVASNEIYRYLFETPPPAWATKMRRFPSVPHPFVIAAPCRPGTEVVAPGQPLGFDLTLMGRANAALPHLVEALQRAVARGIGEGHGRGRLVRIEAVSMGDLFTARAMAAVDGIYHPIEAMTPDVPSPGGRVVVRLMTPLRLVTEEPRDGSAPSQAVGNRRQRLIDQHEFHPRHLTGSIVRRLSMLMHFHCDADLDDTVFVPLKELGKGLKLIEPRLRFVRQSRWSGRQGRDVDVSGICGEFTLDLGAAGPLWPYLWLGQWVHAGKGTVHGLGAYRLLPG